MTNNPSENIWDEFTKARKIVPSMKSWNVDFLKFFVNIIKSFILSSQLGIHL